jgi:hypothetical protein
MLGSGRRILSVLFFLILCNLLQAQRLNTGLTYEIYGIHLTKFPNDIIFSETNYMAYYIKQIQSPGALNMNISANIVVDYSRFFMSLKFGLFSAPNGIKFKYTYPIGGDQFTTYYSKISYQATDISGSVGYFLNAQKFMKPYFEMGIGRISPYFYSEDMSTDPKFLSQWTGRHEITNVLQLDKSYTYIVTGLGFRGDIMAVSARYRIRMGDHVSYYSTLSFGLSIYTKFSKLRKHYIYQPEE